MTKDYVVTEILSKPKKRSLRMDHMIIPYWYVEAVIKHEDDEHETNLTFETQEDADKLKIGDVFCR